MSQRSYDTRIDRTQGSLRHAILAMAASLVLFANALTGLVVLAQGGPDVVLSKALCRSDVTWQGADRGTPDPAPSPGGGRDTPHCLYCLPLLQSGLTPADAMACDPPTVASTSCPTEPARDAIAGRNDFGAHSPRGPPSIA